MTLLSCFTTVGVWENKGKNIDFNGIALFLVEAFELRPLSRRAEIPAVDCFRIAMLPPDEGVRARVGADGWQLVDPRPISADMARYRDFIASSRGEFTVAKDIYVQPNSGWFSDRSACYLAAGRPVVTMRTGFSKFYPVGSGLFEYSNLEEALAGIDAIDCRLSPGTAARRGTGRGIFRLRSRHSSLIGGCWAVT